MIIAIYHGDQPTEPGEQPTDMKELIECDNIKVVKGKRLVRIMMYRNAEFVDNREWTEDEANIFIMNNHGKTVDTIRYRPRG